MHVKTDTVQPGMWSHRRLTKFPAAFEALTGGRSRLCAESICTVPFGHSAVCMCNEAKLK